VQLDYLSMFLKETLRMRPPVGGTTGRTVVADNVVMGGYVIPKGACARRFHRTAPHARHRV
jgi:cytochrome P450